MNTISIPLYNGNDSWFYTRDLNGDLRSFETLDITPLMYPVVFEGVEYDAIVILSNGDYYEAYPLLMEYPVEGQVIAKEILWTCYDNDQEESLKIEITPDDIEEFYK